jgi:hypothetical protein
MVHMIFSSFLLDTPKSWLFAETHWINQNICFYLLRREEHCGKCLFCPSLGSFVGLGFKSCLPHRSLHRRGERFGERGNTQMSNMSLHVRPTSQKGTSAMRNVSHLYEYFNPESSSKDEKKDATAKTNNALKLQKHIRFKPWIQ